MQGLCAHWKGHFDWGRMQERLNSFPQFKLPVPSARGAIDLHFVHATSTHATAKPLLLTHGWPSSVFEFHKLIPMLTQPEKFGGRADQAFHVVAPSIPGYGFSSAPTKLGFGIVDTCHKFHALMLALGYGGGYVAQGGAGGR
jgi:pimeloyl-ACP methyl ester carboxylesterase